jgi:hypothetical protein
VIAPKKQERFRAKMKAPDMRFKNTVVYLSIYCEASCKITCSARFPLQHTRGKLKKYDDDYSDSVVPNKIKDEGVKLKIEEAIKFPDNASEVLGKM